MSTMLAPVRAKEVTQQIFDNINVSNQFKKIHHKKNNWILIIPENVDENDLDNLGIPTAGIGYDNESIYLTLAYLRINSVQTFRQLANSANESSRKRILEILSTINNGWQLVTYKRTSVGQRPAHQKDVSKRTCNVIDDNELTNILTELANIETGCLQRGDINDDGHRINFQLPSLDFMIISVNNDQEQIDNRLDELLKVYNECLNIKSTRKIKTERKQHSVRNKEIDRQILQKEQELLDIATLIEEKQARIIVSNKQIRFGNERERIKQNLRSNIEKLKNELQILEPKAEQIKQDIEKLKNDLTNPE